MSSEDHPTQGVQNAKKKALSNAAWLDTKKSSGHHTTRQLKSIKEDHNGTNFDGTDVSDFEDPKSIAKMLSTEFQVSSRPRTQSTSSLHMLTNEPETPMWADDLIVSESEESCNSDEPAPKSDTSTFINASTLHLAHADTMKMKSEEYLLDTKHKSDASSTVGSELSSHHSRSSSPKLVLTGNRKVKMTDQDITTRRVIQGAILKVKEAKGALRAPF
ncbi:hypothetical protein BDR05DRAFT_1006246 [Suillus weaverae]|nr:hypothetical protein BDR05DRAFT_1006246 [Suillus weaverae]